MNIDKLIDGLYNVPKEITSKIKDNDIKRDMEFFIELIAHSELCVGIELILSDIIECDISISKESYSTLMLAVEYCETPEEYYRDLKYEEE